jgi:hypothetical protein
MIGTVYNIVFLLPKESTVCNISFVLGTRKEDWTYVESDKSEDEVDDSDHQSDCRAIPITKGSKDRRRVVHECIEAT